MADAQPRPDAPPAARPCLVIAAYAAVYPDPIRVRAGDRVTLTGREDNWQGWIWLWGVGPDGREGWLPQDAVTVGVGGDGGVARYDYDARELTVAAGDDVWVERRESGWLWCADRHGAQGWVPANCVSCPEEAA
jgi:hypothetical protein